VYFDGYLKSNLQLTQKRSLIQPILETCSIPVKSTAGVGRLTQINFADDQEERKPQNDMNSSKNAEIPELGGL